VTKSKHALITCEFEGSGYPHEGCAEFGPPDTWGCDRKAVAWVEFTSDGFAGRSTASFLLCEEHKEQAVLDTTGTGDSIEVRQFADRRMGHIDGDPVLGHAIGCDRWNLVSRCTCGCQLQEYTWGHEDCEVYPAKHRVTVQLDVEDETTDPVELFLCQEHARFAAEHRALSVAWNAR
jgi:hypothetical protein